MMVQEATDGQDVIDTAGRVGILRRNSNGWDVHLHVPIGAVLQTVDLADWTAAVANSSPPPARRPR